MQIEVITYGQHQAELAMTCPIAPTGRFTLYQQFELRVLPDPNQQPEYHGKSGLEEDVYHYVLRTPAALKLLPKYWDVVQTLVAFAATQRFTGFRLAFMCGGGFQRSVAVAEYFAAKIREVYPAFDLTVRHLGLEKRELMNPPEGQIRGIVDTIPA